MAFEISNYVGRTLSQRLLLLLFIIHPIAFILLCEYYWWNTAATSKITPLSHSSLYLNIVGGVFCFIYNVDALRSRNMLQIKFNWINLIFQIVGYGLALVWFLFEQNMQRDIYYVMVILAEILLATVVYAFLERKIEREFGWVVYQIDDADVGKQAMWKTYQTYMVYLKALCVNLPFVYLTVVFTHYYRHVLSWTYYALLYSAPAVALGLILCIPVSLYACRTESRGILNLVLVFYVLAIAVIFVQAFLLDFMMTVASWAIIFPWMFALLWNGFRIRRNFGKGMIQYYRNGAGALQHTGIEWKECGQEAVKEIGNDVV